jgi:hypothetical protein
MGVMSGAYSTCRKVEQYKMFSVKTEGNMLFENLKLKWQNTINRTSHSGL